MKRLMNLLMLVILIYTVSVMPINTVVFGIDFSRVFAPEDPAITDASDDNLEVAVTPVNPGALRIAPKTYQVHIDSSKPLTEAYLKEHLTRALTLTDSLGKTTTFEGDQLPMDLAVQSDRFTLSIHIEQATLGTAYDNYRATLELKIGKESFKDTFPILYTAENIAPNGVTAKSIATALAPFFYTDNTGQLSIPVYVPTQQGNNPYRRMINTLNQAPKAAFLQGKQGFPPVKYIWYSAGLLELRMNSAALEPYADQKAAQAALANVINTARYFSRDTVINKVRLQVDNGQTSKAFGGLSLATEYPVDRSPQAFIPLTTDAGVIWLPKSVPASEDMTTTVQYLLQGLQKPHGLVQDPRVTALFPETITIKQATLVSNILRVTFSPNLTSAFGDRPELIRTALEGLSLSLSTIPDVQGVELFAGESKVTQLSSVQLPTILKRPDYYNVLK